MCSSHLGRCVIRVSSIGISPRVAGIGAPRTDQRTCIYHAAGIVIHEACGCAAPVEAIRRMLRPKVLGYFCGQAAELASSARATANSLAEGWLALTVAYRHADADCTLKTISS